MLKIRKITARTRGLEIDLECEPEQLIIEGNASAIDIEADAETEAWIHAELDSGNEWAWCYVRLTVRWNGFEGVDGLGGCSYKSEQDVRKNLLPDMLSEALADLNRKIAEAVEAIRPLVVCS